VAEEAGLDGMKQRRVERKQPEQQFWVCS